MNTWATFECEKHGLIGFGFWDGPPCPSLTARALLAHQARHAKETEGGCWSLIRCIKSDEKTVRKLSRERGIPVPDVGDPALN